MKTLKAAYINELYKLSKKKKIVVAAVLSLAAVVLAGVITMVLNNFMGISFMGRSEFSTFVLTILNQTLIPLFIIFVCADMFAGEFGDHTMKQTLTRPVSRGKIYLAKVMAAGSFILGNLLFIMVVSMVISLLIHTASFNPLRVLVAYLLSAVPLFVFALLVSLVANLMKSGVTTFLLSAVLFFVMAGLGMYFSGYQSFFFTSFFNWFTLFMGSYINISRIIRVLLIFAGCGTMFYAAGYYLFEKREL